MPDTNHPDPAAGGSQCDLIIAALLMHRGEWVSMLDLHRVSGSMAVHSRIADLRRRGHLIEQRSDHSSGKVHSYYRVLSRELQPGLDL